LDLDDKEVVSLPGQTLSEEPSSPLSAHSSVLSEPSFTTTYPSPSIISNVSKISSSLEVALSTRVSMWLSANNSRIPTKATMEGMVRYLLLNPVGEFCSSHPRRCELTHWLMQIVTDAEQHDAIFIGHIAYISSHSLLGILIRQFNEASMFADTKRDIIRIK
jgi:hypothetical protein